MRPNFADFQEVFDQKVITGGKLKDQTIISDLLDAGFDADQIMDAMLSLIDEGVLGAEYGFVWIIS